MLTVESAGVCTQWYETERCPVLLVVAWAAVWADGVKSTVSEMVGRRSQVLRKPRIGWLQATQQRSGGKTGENE